MSGILIIDCVLDQFTLLRRDPCITFVAVSVIASMLLNHMPEISS